MPVLSGAAGSLAPIQPSWALLRKHRGSQTAGGEEFRLLGKMSAWWEQDVSPGQIGSALAAWDRQVSWCWGCGKALINEAGVLWRRMGWEWRVLMQPQPWQEHGDLWVPMVSAAWPQSVRLNLNRVWDEADVDVKAAKFRLL